MRKTLSSLYHAPIPKLGSRLNIAIEHGLAYGSGQATVFFRADDIGVPSPQFFDMVTLFKKYRTPLCLAVVPSWLTVTRYQMLLQSTQNSPLFCWHQHGWMHKNHDAQGKKQEFGDSRKAKRLEDDIKNGKNRLISIIADEFYPVFTPPWNRCGKTALDLLVDLDFVAVSRNLGATPTAPSDLNDFQVTVDLHTRKEEVPTEALDKLCLEIQHSITRGRAGVMLHHQRMNRNSFFLLEKLLKILYHSPHLQTLNFKDLAE